MHLRMVCPARMTSSLVSVLERNEAVTSIAVLRGAAIEPVGDVVMADVAREAATDVIDTLVGLGVEKHGSLSIDEVDVTMSAAAARAQRAAAGLPSDAIVWQELAKRAGTESGISLTFLVLMGVACIIAMIGALTNQPILVVGAMAVGPDFGVLAALSIGIVQGRPKMMLRAVRSLVLGFGLGIACALVAAVVLGWFGLIDRSAVVTEPSLTDFIYEPGALNWVVAFLAGVAGIVSLATARTGALVGVLISVTTIPAAGFLGASLAFSAGAEARGAATQLAINLAMIVAGSIVALSVQRGWHHVHGPSSRSYPHLSQRSARGN